MSESSRAPWSAILAGEAREKSQAAIEEISGELARRYRSIAPSDESAVRASFDVGAAGWGVLFGYLAAARGGEAPAPAADASLHFLEQAGQILENVPMVPALYGGFTGIAWTGAHLDRLRGTGGQEGGNAYDAIDEALSDLLFDPAPWTADFDLINGLVGFGVYALERLPQPWAVSSLPRILDRLEETCERSADGVTWFTPPARVPPSQREHVPHGYYNLGVAHGTPGVVAFLASALEAGVGVERVRPLLTDAVRWLLAHQQPPPCPSRFAMWITPAHPHSDRPSRLAWCYGDLGVSIALLQAARSAREPTWESEALSIARLAAARRGPDTAVLDSGVCHGAAGIGHCFNRLFQATQDPVFEEAARFWLTRSLEMWPPGEGYASLKVWDSLKSDWTVKAGFLEGAAGIALSLLAATTTVEPNWDRALLISLAPQAAR
jgi:hypothetical protein